VVKISPDWVTGQEQGKCGGRIATFSLWIGIFRDGISYTIHWPFQFCYTAAKLGLLKQVTPEE